MRISTWGVFQPQTPDNLETVKTIVLSHGFKVYSDARYLGGFIGDDDSKVIG